MGRKLVRITDREVKALRPRAKPYDRMEGDGFGVRVMGTAAAPVRSFILYTRYPGSEKPTRRTIGKYPDMSLETAREEAGRWRALIRVGKDPRTVEEEKRADECRKRQAEIERHSNSFAVVAEEFIKRHVSKTRKAAIVEREIRREFIEPWGSKLMSEITKKDVVKVIDAAVDRGAPYQAHNHLGHIRALFNWAIGRGIYGIEASPCDRLRPAAVIGKKTSRKRVLSDEEIRALWKASDDLNYPMGPVYKLLLLTGQRKSEIAEAIRSEFDLEKRVWIIPAERMKADASHLVPLSADAITLLRPLIEMKFGKGDHLFTTTFGKKPVNGFSKSKRRLDAAMLVELKKAAEDRGEDSARVKLEPFVIHDIRRTVRTAFSALPISNTVAELVIAHTKQGLHKVYDLHRYECEKRHALDLWSTRLRTILEPAPDNAVRLPQA